MGTQTRISLSTDVEPARPNENPSTPATDSETALFRRAAILDTERKLGPKRLRAIKAVARRFRAYYRRLYLLDGYYGLRWKPGFDPTSEHGGVNYGTHIPVAACEASMALPDDYETFREAYLSGDLDGQLFAVLMEEFGGPDA